MLGKFFGWQSFFEHLPFFHLNNQAVIHQLILIASSHLREGPRLEVQYLSLC
jgi:hypothetical protein